MIVRPALPEHYDWIAKRAELIIGPAFRAIECVEGEQILGMVGFEIGMPNAVSLHIAIEEPEQIPRPVRREALRRLVKDGFGIAFNGLGKGVAIATVLSSNERSRRFVERLGFRLIGIVEDAWGPGVDLDLYQMRRSECRWLEA